MDQSSTLAKTDQASTVKTLLSLQSKVKWGMSWFLVIAGVSIINAVIFYTGGSKFFALGLGATQLIEQFVSALVWEVNSSMKILVQILGYGLEFILISTFIACGILGRNRVRWAVILGMVLYGLDSLLYPIFAGWSNQILLILVVHALPLFGLWKWQKAIKDLVQLEKDLGPEMPPSLQTALTNQMATERKKIRELLIILAPLTLILLVLLGITYLNK
ncbi:MAG TPA: hypothetical protein PKG95_05765 [Anaerolineaceae bacterium]|nr:hypothetical protein [Anaerolineaceae bacterium]